jgi:UDP-N-acetylmuramate dehydrogenase
MNKNIKKLLPGVRKNVLLNSYSTFKIGGRAKYFFVATKKEDLIKAINTAKKIKSPFFILGQGSNLLISDKGFIGFVVRLQVTGYRLKGNTIYAEAGVLLSRLVSLALENNLTGLEWAVGIPGTVGGAINGNAGAFGQSMAEMVKEVEVYDVKNKKVRNLKNKNCKFSYRESIFKNNKDLIIISANLRLKKGNKGKIKQKIKEYLKQRIKTQPLKLPSIGSIFKNPEGLFAGELIEKCGLKGKRIGDVKISEKHANFIINLGKGKAKEVRKLITFIKKKVKERFGITLEEEIQYLGF